MTLMSRSVLIAGHYPPKNIFSAICRAETTFFTKLKVPHQVFQRLLISMKQVAALLLTLMTVIGQTQPPKSFVGTVIVFQPERAAVEIRPDSGADRVVVELTRETITQAIVPGARDLKTA